MTDLSKLQSLADDCKGWQNLTHSWIGEEEDVDRDHQDWLVGAEDEDGEKYPVMTVDTCQYDAPSAAEPLAKFYAAANPSAILALIADLQRLEKARATDAGMIMDMTRDIVSVGEALGIPGEEQEGGVGEFIEAIEQLKQTAPDFALRARVADLLHLLQFAKIETPSAGDAAQAEIARSDLAHMLAISEFARIVSAPTPPAQQPVAVPEGYRLLPVKITPQMIEGAMAAHYGARRLRQAGGPGGVDMTVNCINYNGTQAMKRMWAGALSAAPTPPAQEQAEHSAWVEQVMVQAQVFASAWSLVGGPFDTGNGLEQAEEEKERLRALLGGVA